MAGFPAWMLEDLTDMAVIHSPSVYSPTEACWPFSPENWEQDLEATTEAWGSPAQYVEDEAAASSVPTAVVVQGGACMGDAATAAVLAMEDKKAEEETAVMEWAAMEIQTAGAEPEKLESASTAASGPAEVEPEESEPAEVDPEKTEPAATIASGPAQAEVEPEKTDPATTVASGPAMAEAEPETPTPTKRRLAKKTVQLNWTNGVDEPLSESWQQHLRWSQQRPSRMLTRVMTLSRL